MRPLYSLTFLCSIVLASLPFSVGADELDDTFQDHGSGITLQVPHGWLPHRQIGYPELLLVLVSSRGDATITLGAGALLPGQTLKAYLDGTCNVLRRIGVIVSQCALQDRAHPGWQRVSGRLGPAGPLLEQLYLLDNGRAVVLSLSASSINAASHAADLLWILDNLTLEPRNVDAPRNNVIRGVKMDPATRPPADDAQDGLPPGAGAQPPEGPPAAGDPASGVLAPEPGTPPAGDSETAPPANLPELEDEPLEEE